MKITNNQKLLLIAFSQNDHVCDYGWEDEEYAVAWNDCLADDMVKVGIERPSIGGTLAKADEAGLISTYGGKDGTTTLTELGRSVLADILQECYLDYLNNYIHSESYATNNGFAHSVATRIISSGMVVHYDRNLK